VSIIKTVWRNHDKNSIR